MLFEKNTLLKNAAISRSAKSIGLLALSLCATSGNSVHAATETTPGSLHRLHLGWNPVPEADVEGYNVYVGTTRGAPKQVARNVNRLDAVIDALEYGKTYYVSVTAVRGGLESPPSAEMKVQVTTPPLPGAGRIEMSASKEPGFKWSFPKAALATAPEFVVHESSDLSNWTEVGKVLVTQAVAQDSEKLEFEWPVNMRGPQKYYRLSASNWIGSSTAP